MTPFTTLTAVAAPLLRDNIDTDAIIPSREITSVSKSGMAAGLFAGWRYTTGSGREPKADFVLNQPAFKDAQILLAGANLGCGSSREQAVWALSEYGFRVLIAASFNPIFFRNCVRNGLLPATLPAPVIDAIAAHVAADPQRHRLTVDLAAQTIAAVDWDVWTFDLPADDRDMLLHGMDPIDRTLQLREQIERFRSEDRRRRPWIYGPLHSCLRSQSD